MDAVLILIQAALLIAACVILWQIWNLLHSDPASENEPLGEERAKYITDRLDWIKYLMIAEVLVFVIKTFLDIWEIFQ